MGCIPRHDAFSIKNVETVPFITIQDLMSKKSQVRSLRKHFRNQFSKYW